MTRNGKHSLRVVGASVLFALLVAATAWFLRNNSGLSQPAQIALALVPVVPGVLLAWLIMRQINAMDEFVRKVQLDSLAVAAAGTALLTFSYGFFEAAGFPKLSMFYVWPLMAAIWVVSCGIRLFLSTRDASRT